MSIVVQISTEVRMQINQWRCLSSFITFTCGCCKKYNASESKPAFMVSYSIQGPFHENYIAGLKQRNYFIWNYDYENVIICLLIGSPFIVSPHPLNDVNFKVLKSISLAFQHTIFNWLHLYRRRTGSQELSKWYLMCPDKVKRQKSYTKHALFPAMNCSLKLRKWICKFIVKLF